MAGNLELMEKNQSCDGNVTAIFRREANKTGEDLPELGLDYSVPLTVIGFAVLVSNGLVCILFCRFRALRTITNTFIVSLAISDLMVATVFIPTYLAGLAVNPYIIAYILFAYLFNFCGITWDRYQAVLNPLMYRSVVTRAIVYKILALVWTIPLLLAIIPIFWEYRNGVKLLAGRIYQGILVALVILCSGSICWAYGKIFGATRRQVKQMIEMHETNARFEHSVLPDRQSGRSMRKRRSITISNEVKAAKVFALVGGTFAVCWLPLIIINVFSALDYSHIIPNVFLDVSLYSLVGNALADPLIYSFYKSDYRRAFKRFFCGKKPDHDKFGNSITTRNSVLIEENSEKIDENLI